MDTVVCSCCKSILYRILRFIRPLGVLRLALTGAASGTFLMLFAGIAARAGTPAVFHPEIPRAWDEREVSLFQVLLSERDRSPRYMSSQEYYAQQVRPIYKTYPVYAPGREPAGYMEALGQKDPQIAFDVSKLHTKEDWIRAGETVFDAAPEPIPVPPLQLMKLLTRQMNIPTTPDGVIPFLTYVVRKKGEVEMNLFSCATCHTRVLPDGSLVKGAQGNAPFEQTFAALAKLIPPSPEADMRARDGEWTLAGAPWVAKREELDKQFNLAELIRRHSAMPPGVIERHGTSSTEPSKIPSLIGLQDIKYLDSTGLVRHRSIGDLMRYVITNYGLDIIAHYGDFQPSQTQTGFGKDGTRFSDEQLYALSLYIYSLRPPPNPNHVDDLARRGEAIFEDEGCISCHTPPFYTNNKLNPVVGFQVPKDLHKTDAIMTRSVETDPQLATTTRRGTGFYKVPSLRGVWYRSAFGHNGQAASLEEWLDPERLRPDYVPKGFHLAPGPIQGHPFGLDLTVEDKKALIAFLKTL